MSSMVVKEATTDASGKFRIPSWGPLARPEVGVLDVRDPELVIVKSGYLVARKNNYNPGIPVHARLELVVRDSVWNGKDIEIKQHNGDKATYMDKFIPNFNTLRVVYDSPDCKWKQIPKAVLAFEAERRYQESIGQSIWIVPPLTKLLARPECQPTDEFRRAYDEKQ